MTAAPKTLTTPTDSNTGTANHHERNDDEEIIIERTLFLIRHGEACHNVQEKLAKKIALQKAMEEGLDPDCEETKRRIAQSRQAILEDPQFFNAPLSQRGEQQAREAARLVKEELSVLYGEPTEVLVSPLERTLKTAATIFPNHDNIRVREELRERLTGRPADNFAPNHLLMERRPSFTNFSFKHIRLGTFIAMRSGGGGSHYSTTKSSSAAARAAVTTEGSDNNSESRGRDNNDHDSSFRGDSGSDDCMKDDSVRSVETTATEAEKEEIHFRRGLLECTLGESSSGISAAATSTTTATNSSSSSSTFNNDDNNDDNYSVEDEDKLCIRTKKLFHMLAHSDATTIAIVSHKAYLRALERCAFGQPDALEFDNCEIRVYRVKFTYHHHRYHFLETVERLR